MGSPELAVQFLQLIIYPGQTGSPPAEIAWVKDTLEQQTFDLCLKDLRALKASKGRFTCLLRVGPNTSNRFHTLHGGCTATHSVSLSLSCDYLSPMPEGEDCLVEASVVRMGGRTALLHCDFTRVSTGELVAQGKHLKVLQHQRPKSQASKQTSKL